MFPLVGVQPFQFGEHLFTDIALETFLLVHPPFVIKKLALLREKFIANLTSQNVLFRQRMSLADVRF